MTPTTGSDDVVGAPRAAPVRRGAAQDRARALLHLDHLNLHVELAQPLGGGGEPAGRMRKGRRSVAGVYCEGGRWAMGGDVPDACGQGRRRVLVHLLVDRERKLCSPPPPGPSQSRGQTRQSARRAAPCPPWTRRRRSSARPSARTRSCPASLTSADSRGDPSHERCAASETIVGYGCDGAALVIAVKGMEGRTARIRRCWCSLADDGRDASPPSFWQSPVRRYGN